MAGASGLPATPTGCILEGNWGTIGATGSIIGTILGPVFPIVNAIAGVQVRIEGIRTETTVRDLAVQKALCGLTEGQARIEGRLAGRASAAGRAVPGPLLPGRPIQGEGRRDARGPAVRALSAMYDPALPPGRDNPFDNQEIPGSLRAARKRSNRRA